MDDVDVTPDTFVVSVSPNPAAVPSEQAAASGGVVFGQEAQLSGQASLAEGGVPPPVSGVAGLTNPAVPMPNLDPKAAEKPSHKGEAKLGSAGGGNGVSGQGSSEGWVPVDATQVVGGSGGMRRGLAVLVTRRENSLALQENSTNPVANARIRRPLQDATIRNPHHTRKGGGRFPLV